MVVASFFCHPASGLLTTGLLFTGYPANSNFAAPYKVLLRKRGLLTPTSRSYAPEQHGIQVLSEQ